VTRLAVLAPGVVFPFRLGCGPAPASLHYYAGQTAVGPSWMRHPVSRPSPFQVASEREKCQNCQTAKPSPTHVSPTGPITVLQRGSRAVHQSLPVHLLAGFWGSFSSFLSNSALAGRVHSRLSSPRVLPVRSPHPSKTGPAISPPCGSRPGFLSLPTPRQVPSSDIVHSHLA
jgi:hypothetical protein